MDLLNTRCVSVCAQTDSEKNFIVNKMPYVPISWSENSPTPKYVTVNKIMSTLLLDEQ